MSTPAAIILVLALLAFCLFVVLAVGVGRNALRLVRSGMRSVDEITPQIQHLGSEANLAQERAAQLQERSAEVRERLTAVGDAVRRIGR